jgi:hypothetical protein
MTAIPLRAERQYGMLAQAEINLEDFERDFMKGVTDEHPTRDPQPFYRFGFR